MARPSEQRTERLNLRLTAAELARLQRDADTAAVELSTLARAVLLRAPIPRRARRRSPDHLILGQAIGALNSAGGNINQLIKLAQQTGDFVAYKLATADRAALATAVQKVIAALTS